MPKDFYNVIKLNKEQEKKRKYFDVSDPRLASAISNTFDYARQNADKIREVANTLNYGMTQRKPGDVATWDYDVARQTQLANAQAIKAGQFSNLFNTREYAFDNAFVNLTGLDYLTELSKSLEGEISASRQQDEDARQKANQFAETASGLKVQSTDHYHTLPFADLLDVYEGDEELIRPIVEDWLSLYGLTNEGDASAPKTWDELRSIESEDEYQKWLEMLNSNWVNADWNTVGLTDYDSATEGLMANKKTVDSEIARRSEIGAMQESIRNDPNYDVWSVYTDPGYESATPSFGDINSQVNAVVRDTYVKGYDDINRFINSDADWSAKMAAAEHDPTVRQYLDNGYDYLTPDEIADYNALINAGRTEDAARYLELLRNDLLYRRAMVSKSFTEAKATNPYLAVPAWMEARLKNVANIFSIPQQMYEALTGIDNPYSSAFDMANSVNWTGSAQLGAIDKANTYDWLKTAMKFGYNAATGATDNAVRLVASGMNPVAALTMAGLQSGSASLHESASRDDMSGAAKILQAIATGAMEVGTEKIGLDALFSSGKDGAAAYLKEVILSELGEESLNYAAEDVIDSVVAFLFGHEAEIKSGPEFWQGLLETGVTTALSAGISGAGGLAVQRHNTSSVGNSLKNQGDLESMLSIAEGMQQNTESYKMGMNLRNKQKNGGKITNYDLGKFVKKLSDDIGEENSSVIRQVYDEAIENRLIELGESPEDAKANAPAIRQITLGEKMSLWDRESARWSDNATQVVKELIVAAQGDSDSAYRWADDARINSFAATRKVAEKGVQFARALKKPESSAAATKATEAAAGKSKDSTTPTSRQITYNTPSSGTKGAGELVKVVKHDGLFGVEISSDGGKTTTEISIDDVTNYGGSGVGAILEYTKEANHDMSAEEVNNMIGAYEQTGGDAKSFIDDYESAYLSGYSGIDMPSSRLSAAIRSIAYEHGKQEAAKEESQRIARTQRARKVDKPTVGWLGDVENDSAIKGPGDSAGLDNVIKDMTDMQQAMVAFGRQLAESAKINVTFYASKANEAGMIAVQNGSYDPNTHTIYLDINSGAVTQSGKENLEKKGTLGDAVGRVLGHEVTHVLESTSSVFYAKYRQAVKDALKAKGVDYATLIREKINTAVATGEKLTYAGAEAEVIADASEYMLQDSKFVRNMETGLKGKVKEIARKFLNKVNEAFRRLRTSGHVESRVLRTMTDGVAHYEKKLQDLWDMAFDEMLGAEEVKNDVVDALYETGEIYSYTVQKSRRVRDEKTVAYLENQQHITTYRAMQVIDGELYPPMAEFIGSKKDGNREDPGVLGRWEMAVEHPELIKWVNGKPKFELKKTNDDGSVSTVPAAYNPYMHSSNTVLNDQFSKAFQRENLVVVECVVPVSESDGAYRAQYAKDATGWHEWKSGVVAGDLAKQKGGFRRDVFLSRYIKPVRILSDAEVAKKIAEYLDGTDVTVPFQSAWPSLREALVQAGVNITEPRGLGASQMKIAMEAFEEWKRGNAELPKSERSNVEHEDIRYSRRNGYLLDGGEYARFKRNWESRKTNHFTRRKNGGILIDMGNLLVYTNRNGTPQHVLEILTDDLWTDNNIVQKAALLETEGYDIDEQQEILESTCGAGSFRFRVPGDRSGNRWEAGTGKRQNSRDVRGTDREEQSAEGTSAETEITDSPDGIEIDDDTESAYPTQKSIRTWEESDYVAHRNEAAERLAKSIGVTVEKAKKWIDDVNSISAYILNNKARLDYIPTAVKGMSAFKSNPEYGGSIDMSTICAKRRLATGTLDAIQRILGDVVLTKDDFLHIREMMKERGHEVACGLCFVESSRKNLSKYNKQFLDQYKDSHPDSDLSMVDLNTVEGLERIRSNPETADVYEAYEKFMNKLAQRKPKLFEKRTEYNHEVLKKFKSDTTVGIKNRNGGLRLQSFSDFEIVHLIDMMQVITDMASVGLAGQAYTKVPEFAWALGNTGLKINLSLIAKDVDADGNLTFDPVEGMDPVKAKELRDYYSKNVGTIVVTFTDEQTIAAMKSDFIDYIIPFHRSQWQKSDYKKLGLPEGTKDYTLHQNEKEGRKRVKDNYLPNAYWNENLSGTENARAYLEMCAKAGRTPKFAKFLDRQADGSYKLKADGSTDGYWKLLIDFKMYDNEGNYSKQMPVQPVFNMDQAMDMLEKYKGEHDTFPVAQDVVDDFVKEYRGEVGGVKNVGGRFTVDPVQKSRRDLPEDTTSYRDYLADADDSAAATIEEKNALTIYQKLLKNHAAASDAVIAAEQALLAAGEEDKPEARKALTAARAKQRDIYNRLLNVERTAHVQNVVNRTNQLMNDLSGKTSDDVAGMIADRERKIESLKADITGLKGAARTQREADIRENERMIRQLKSDAAQALLKNSEKYNRRIDEIRMQRDLNIEIGKRTRHIKRIVKRLNDRIVHEEDYKNVKEPLKPAVHALVRTFIDGFGGMVFDSKSADRLRSVYDELAKEDGAPEFYSDDVADWLSELSSMKEWDALVRAEGGSTVGRATEKLSMYSRVAEIADHIYKLVTDADEIFINGKRESLSGFVSETGNSLVSHKDRRLLVGKARDAARVLDDLLVKGNLTPQYFFEHLKNSGMTRLFDGLMSGQREYAQLVRQGQEAVADAKSRYNFYAWKNMKIPVEFKTEQGHTIGLTVPQMMWVYATAKREATNKLADTHHLDQGGFKYDAKDLPRRKGKLEAIPGSERLHKLSKADVEMITNALTAEQKACADELVGYLSNECAEQGNRASMELFGIRKYNEEYYFPFKTASDQRYQRSDAGSASTTNDARAKHTRFTHSLRRGANTPLVMGNFFDVIADHINLMATYSSFVVPIESMNRVLNTKINEEADGSGSDVTIRSLVGRKYGEPSQKYIADLLKDLNGGPQTDNRGGISALFRAFKRGAVMGSLSVTLQQPTAIVRAFAYVNPKYFAHITMEGNKKTWERMMKHSGTAVIKEMGKFDVGTGHMANDWISNSDIQDYNVIKRARFLLDTNGWSAVKNNVIETLTAMPGIMDRITWTHIWKAVEAEQADLHPEMNRDSSEFLDMVGKRFDDVINHTQVYDSILAKSQNMRSKNPLTQMSTAFMSEPTLNANMYYSAIRGEHSSAQRAGMITSVVASNILAAAFAAAISAWNKDDDKRKFGEKYLAAFSSRAIDNLNPMTMIPYLSDLWSVVSGYDIERTDMSVVKDLYDYTTGFFGKLIDGEQITWRDRENFYGSIANLFGVPVKNISRDARRIWNLFHTDMSASSPASLKYTLLENAIPLGLWADTNKAYCQRLVAAAVDEDSQEANDLWEYITESKKISQGSLETNIRSILKELVIRGDITPEQATKVLRKYVPYKDDKNNINKPKEWLEGE